LLGSEEFPFGSFFIGDIRVYRHDAAGWRPAAANPVGAAVRRVIFEGFARWIAQAVDSLGDQHFGVTLAVVPVRCQETQKVRVVTPRLEQMTRGRIHFPEAIVAKHDVQVVVGVDERAGHVIQCNFQLGLGGPSSAIDLSGFRPCVHQHGRCEIGMILGCPGDVIDGVRDLRPSARRLGKTVADLVPRDLGVGMGVCGTPPGCVLGHRPILGMVE